MKTIQIPTEYRRLFDTDWREAAVWGGRYSLKSHTIARYLLIEARQKRTRVLCGREFQNSIADSSLQLLKDLIEEYEMKEFVCTNNSIVNTLNGSDFIFKGLWNNEQSIKSIEGIDIAWIEEAQTISSKSIDVLTPTVRKPGSKIIYSYNRLLEDDPVHKRLVIEGRPNTLKINVNYDIAKKYGMIPDVILNEIEDDKKNRPSLYKHKWLGEPNGLELKIYKDWAEMEEIPEGARPIRLWLDFGYSNDPTAIGVLYKYQDAYILDELCYRKGLLNSDIASVINNSAYKDLMVIADSSEPKSIDEIALYGINIYPAVKGPGSINTGINFVKQQKVYVTKRSINIWNEYKNYMFEQDRNGRILNEPRGGYDHHMDGIRYALNSILEPVSYERGVTISHSEYIYG